MILFKAAKKYNLESAEIVKILSDNGVTILNKPNAKLSTVAHQIITKYLESLIEVPSITDLLPEVSDTTIHSNNMIIENRDTNKELLPSVSKTEVEEIVSIDDHLDSEDGYEDIVVPQYIQRIPHENGFPQRGTLSDKFNFFIQRILGGGALNNYITHLQIQSKFLRDNSMALEYTNEIVSNFKDYFEYQSTTKKRIDLKKVYRDYPEFWNENKENLSKEQQINRGLGDEIKKQEGIEFYVKFKIIKKERDKNSSLYLYVASLTDERDQDTQLQEDIVLKVIKPISTSILILQHDVPKNIVFFESYFDFRVNSDITIKYNSAWILKKLRFRLQEINIGENKFFKNVVTAPEIEIIKTNKVPSVYAGLSPTQQNCIKTAIGQEITFIWGPPGTGKTTTLAGLIENLSNAGERTLVCSISNIAVDQILTKYLEKIKSNQSINKSQIIRAGNYYSEELIKEHPEIFASSDKIKKVTKELSEARLKLLDEKSEQAKAQILKDISQFKVTLKTLQKSRYAEAKTIFCSAAYTLFDEILLDNSFHNLIIDEVSMMNIPYIIWLANFTRKRIILTGDFRQLGPIASSTTRYARLWMKRDVFQLLHNDYNFDNLGVVFQLVEQYRMNDHIKAQINELYNNKLTTISKESQTKFSNILSPHPILFRNLSATINKGKAGSKYNEASFKCVLDFVDKIIKECNNVPSIGIITPFKEQANKYKSHFASSENITAGTIHSFQGSDRDIVIIDLVESSKVFQKNKEVPNSISMIFYNIDGLRLMNVAISRAKSKLIVVADENFFKEAGKTLVSPLLKSIIIKLSKFKEG